MNVRIRSLYLCVTDMDRAIDFYVYFPNGSDRRTWKKGEISGKGGHFPKNGMG